MRANSSQSDGAEANVGELIAQRERREDVAFDVELARHVRPRDAELARRGERVAQRLG